MYADCSRKKRKGAALADQLPGALRPSSFWGLLPADAVMSF